LLVFSLTCSFGISSSAAGSSSVVSVSVLFSDSIFSLLFVLFSTSFFSVSSDCSTSRASSSTFSASSAFSPSGSISTSEVSSIFSAAASETVIMAEGFINP